jgi:preprotein translocase subunit SecE
MIFVSKIGWLSRPVSFFKDLKSEIKKIVWPKPKMVFKNANIVLLMIFLVGIFVFVLDAGLVSLLGLVMEVSR